MGSEKASTRKNGFGGVGPWQGKNDRPGEAVKPDSGPGGMNETTTQFFDTIWRKTYGKIPPCW